MEFREALLFLAKHFEANVSHLADVADALVLATSPMTAERAAAEIYNPEYHYQRKINFLKDVRNYARDNGAEVGLKEAKDAVEAFLSRQEDPALAAPRQKLMGEQADDEDRAYAEYRERQAEQGTWFGAPGPMDEEPF